MSLPGFWLLPLQAGWPRVHSDVCMLQFLIYNSGIGRPGSTECWRMRGAQQGGAAQLLFLQSRGRGSKMGGRGSKTGGR